MIITSPHAPVEIPETTLYDHLFATLSTEDSARPALVEGETGRTVSYGELRAQVDGFAGALAARGIGPGDVVAVQMPNRPEFVSVFHGILRSGAAATTINSLYTAEEVARQLQASRASLLVTVSALSSTSVTGAEQAGLTQDQVIMVDDDGVHPTLATLLSEGRAAPEVSVDPAEDVAVLPYSSGTTGNPKGVRLTHRNLVANLCQVQDLLPAIAGDTVQGVLPMFHIYGMTMLMNFSLHHRATLVTMASFDLGEFLRIIAEHRIRLSFIAPPVAVALAKHPMVDEFDLSSLEVMLSGAAPLDEVTAKTVAERIDCDLRQGYGMTELSPVSHLAPAGGEDPLGSVGPGIPNTESLVVDPADGTPVDIPADGESAPGELWVRGPMVMKGYLDDQQATEATLTEDGFLRTGDIVTHHAGGWFTVVDRVKELIKYKGYQVAPAELESLLLEHDQIADAAVIGVKDAEAGEIPKAYVVPSADATLTTEDVIAHVAGRVGAHKKIRAVEFIEQVPKSSSGKILRRQLR